MYGAQSSSKPHDDDIYVKKSYDICTEFRQVDNPCVYILLLPSQLVYYSVTWQRCEYIS